MLEDRIAADLEVEVDSELVAEVESLVRRHPLRERLRAQLMLALYRSGRQADALAAYHDARRTLVDELGIEPGPELQALYGSILRQERSLVRVAPPALDDHYDEVLRAFSAGRLVPVLGPAAGGVDGHELATLLAERFELDTGGRGLAYVSQAVAARNGIGPLHDELHLALDRDVEPSPLHAWLAGAAAVAARHRGLPQQLIVSTGFDTGVERAFEAAGEELDVVVYVAAGRDRGKFLHIAPDGAAVVVDEPNAYTGLALDERSVLLKIHGHVDRGAHARAGELRGQRGRPHRLPRRRRRCGHGAGAARGAAAPKPSPLPRLRRRRLEPAGLPAPRLGRRPARVPLLGGAAGGRARRERALARARRRGVRRLARRRTPRSSRG